MREEEFARALAAAERAALRYLSSLDAAPLGPAHRERVPSASLPVEGIGAEAAVERLLELAADRARATAGPRCFDFVIGGVTPAALAADWIASAWDQVASSVAGSPLAVDLEELVTSWVLELVGVDPEPWTGTLVTGASMANVVGLAAAREWVGDRRGVDVARDGLAALGPVPVLSSGFVHATVPKALALLGMGRRSLRRFSADNRGTLDAEGLVAAIEGLGGAPFILVATAGEVNSGASDDLELFARLAREHGGWLHVDGAFGLFAGASPRTADQVRGLAAADSIATDAHKWLNVPYDCGIAYVRQRSMAARVFRLEASYLQGPPAGGERRRVPANLGPESSRRARALPLFASLVAHGADGYRAMFEGHLDLAGALADRVRRSPNLELVDGPPPLCIVPFRCTPAGVPRRALDDLNERVARRLARDGRVSMTLTRYRSVVCFRPAIVNWRTRRVDVELLVNVVEECLEAELGGAAAGTR